MRLEIDSTPAIAPSAEVLADLTPDHSLDAGHYLDAGIKAAQAGDRTNARAALLRATELDPGSESAWLWLASISEYPEELLVFLDRVLTINPENARALEWQAATNTLLSKTFVQRGIDAADSGQKDVAADHFGTALEYDERNALAWMWMASLSESNDGRLLYIEKALSIEPENEAAQNALNSVREEIIEKNMADARVAVTSGNTTDAMQLLDAVVAFAPEMQEAWRLRALFSEGFVEKLTAFEKLALIDPFDGFIASNLDYLRSLAASIPPSEREWAGVEPASHEPDSMAMAEVSRLEEEVPTEKTPTQDLEMPAGVAEAFSQAAEPEPIAVEIPQNFVSEIPVLVEPETFVGENHDAVGEFSPLEPNIDPEDDASYQLQSAYEAAVAETDIFEKNNGYAQPFASQTDGHYEAVDLADHATEAAHIGIEAPAEVNEFSNGHDPDADVDPYSTFYSSSLLDVIVPDAPVTAARDEQETVEYQFETAQQIDVESETADNNEPSEDFSAPSAEPHRWVAEEPGVYQFESVAPQENDVAPTEDRSETIWQTDPYDSFAAGIPMPEMDLEEPAPAVNEYSTRIVPSEDAAKAATICAYCGSANEPLAISCQACMAVLTLSDLEMLLANQHVDRGLMRSAIEALENDRSHRQFGESELTILGIGHLNLRNFDEGYKCLAEASALNPNNVVLGSQVNALNIRLNEIRAQEEAHSTMSRGKTILVVDDSPTILKLIAGKLEKCGHEVYCSADGEQAMERLRDLVPDLILLDINMPKIDGYQVCKMIRSTESIKDIPVVMISGKDGFFDKVRGKMAGTSGYITKPFGPETLMKIVEGYLQGQPAPID